MLSKNETFTRFTLFGGGSEYKFQYTIKKMKSYELTFFKTAKNPTIGINLAPLPCPYGSV